MKRFTLLKLTAFILALFCVQISYSQLSYFEWDLANSHFTWDYTPHSQTTETSYTWTENSTEVKQRVFIDIESDFQHEKELYVEQGNFELLFKHYGSYAYLAYTINGGSVNTSSIQYGSNFLWSTIPVTLNNIGTYTLQFEIVASNGTSDIMDIKLVVIPKSDGFYSNNFDDNAVVWKSHTSSNNKPVIISEGFDSYDTRSPQFYWREGAGDLIQCFLNNGYDVFLLDYGSNGSIMQANATSYRSLVRKVSQDYGGRDVLMGGMSMGGVIARYGAASADDEGVPLPISHLITFDSPHQGAVINESFQNEMHTILTGDLWNLLTPSQVEYSKRQLNNWAAKQLLVYNAFDPNGVYHNLFFNELNGMSNGGYPSGVKTVGVSFSDENPNPLSGHYITTVRFSGEIVQHMPSPLESVAGSYLPEMPSVHNATLVHIFADNASSDVRPTFIPAFSALDLQGNQTDFTDANSGFDKIITTDAMMDHDKLHQSIMNAILEKTHDDIVFVQNELITEDREYRAPVSIVAGSDVVSYTPVGSIIVSSGTEVIFTAGESIFLEPGFAVMTGGEFTAWVDPSIEIGCDGDDYYQGLLDNDNTVALQEANPEVEEVEEREIELSVQKFEVGVHPNPIITGNLNIDLVVEKEGSVSIKLFAITGNLVSEIDTPFSLSKGAHHFQLNTENLQAGMYFVEVILENERQITKVIKQ